MRSKFCMFGSLLAGSLLAAGAGAAPNYVFTPETGGLDIANMIAPLPTVYDFNTSQYSDRNYQQSFWSSSFLTCSDNKQFMVLSHVLVKPGGNTGLHRASILDLQTFSYRQFVVVGNLSSQKSANLHAFNYTFDDWTMGSVTDDPLAQIHTMSNHGDVQFDLTYDLGGPALLNAGDGWFGIGKGGSGEWAAPAGQTYGSIFDGNTTLKVDTARSLTWYDRQWVAPNAQSSNWTWFELHVSNACAHTNEKLSVWLLDDVARVNPRKQWTTLRQQPGVHTFLPISSYHEHPDQTWKSPYTDVTYYQGWNITLLDGTSMMIKTVTEDQELHDPTGKLIITYEGFVTVTGESKNGESIQGWGLVEIMPAPPS